MTIDIYVGTDSYINALANEYFSIAGDKRNVAREKMLKNRLAYEMIYKKSNSVCKKATAVASKVLEKHYALGIMTEPEELLNLCFMRVIKNYSSEKSDNFVQWFLDNIKYTATKEFESYYKRVKNEDGKLVREQKTIAVEVKDSDDETINIFTPENFSDGSSPAIDTEAKLYTEAFFIKLSTCITRMCRNGSTPKMYRYFRCFTTDLVISACKNEKLHRRIDINENDTMKAMDETFLDYSFTRPCRTFVEIEQVPLKSYSELGLSDKTESIRSPFELKIFAEYFGVSEAAISLNKEKFYKLIEIK